MNGMDNEWHGEEGLLMAAWGGGLNGCNRPDMHGDVPKP